MKKLVILLCAMSLTFLGVGPAAALTILTEDFYSGIPGDWTVDDHEGNGVVWTDIAGSGESGNYTGGSEDAATVSSDAFGPAGFDTSLLSPEFDLTGVVSAELSFLANYQNFASLDYFEIELSSGGG